MQRTGKSIGLKHMIENMHRINKKKKTLSFSRRVVYLIQA